MTYRMSSFGGCPRAAVAAALGYSPYPRSEQMERIARAGRRHETWLSEDLSPFGYLVMPPRHCKGCNADGIHVELPDFPMLTGHIDRVGIKTTGPRTIYLVELKSLGKQRAEQLRRALEIPDLFLAEFRSYAYQVSAYHYASNLPILYVIKERESEKVTTHLIPPPISLEDIVTQIQYLEQWATKDALPLCLGAGFEAAVCPFPYLCGVERKYGVERKPTGKSVDTETTAQYRKLRDQKKDVERQMAALETQILAIVRETGRAEGDGLQFTYIAPTQVVTYPKKAVEAMVPKEVLAKIGEMQERKEHLRVTELSS